MIWIIVSIQEYFKDFLIISFISHINKVLGSWRKSAFYVRFFFFSSVDRYITSVFFPVLTDISRLLNTGLDAETLAICVRLCEAGVNPEALAKVIQDLRRETAALKVMLK